MLQNNVQEDNKKLSNQIEKRFSSPSKWTIKEWTCTKGDSHMRITTEDMLGDSQPGHKLILSGSVPL